MPKAKSDLFSSNVTLVFHAKGDKCELFPDISDEEMFAIGHHGVLGISRTRDPR